MEEELCKFPGCTKPVFRSCKHTQMNPVACGRLHHFQIMCQRYCSLHPEQRRDLEAFYTLSNPSTCGLEGCERECWVGHSWCSRTHYLHWLRNFQLRLSERQVCGLPQCNRHVYVEISCDGDKPHGKVHHFCGWKHTQKYYRDGTLPLLVNHPSSPAQSEANGHGHSNITHFHESSSIEYVIDSLIQWVLHKVNMPKTVQINNEFFSKHPWEVLVAEHQSCVFITKRTYKSKADGAKRTRHRITKEGYHWKPTGMPLDYGKGVTKRYLTYKKMAGTVESSDEPGDKSFAITEFTVDCSPDYCAIHLYRKNSTTSQRKETVAQKRKKSRKLAPLVSEEEETLGSTSNSIKGGDRGDVIERSCAMEDGVSSCYSNPLLFQDEHSHGSIYGNCDAYKVGKYPSIDVKGQAPNLATRISYFGNSVMALHDPFNLYETEYGDYSPPCCGMLDHRSSFIHQEAPPSHWTQEILFPHNA